MLYGQGIDGAIKWSVDVGLGQNVLLGVVGGLCACLLRFKVVEIRLRVSFRLLLPQKCEFGVSVRESGLCGSYLSPVAAPCC